MIESIFDGIQRPLDEVYKQVGARIARGVEVPALNRTKKWDFVPVVAVGQEVVAGDVLGTVQETSLVSHKIMVPYGVEGKVNFIHQGEATVEDVVAKIEQDGKTVDVKMLQQWPVRRGRPYRENCQRPLITGQRVVICSSPLPRDAIPGPSVPVKR